MTTKPRGSRGTTVKQAAIDDAQLALQALPDKPKEKLSLKEAVEKLKAPLQAALAKGYSYQELAMMLKENDIVISAATLKNYVPVGKRAAKNQVTSTKPRRGAKKAEPQDDAAIEQLTQAASELSASPDSLNGTAATTPPSRRGRASSKAETSASPKGRGKAASSAPAEGADVDTAKPTTRRRSSAAKTSTGTQRTTKRMSSR
ncbi:hypothetical protein [Pantanalinema sp. GBBB05]|uniref:hypothetical protein n=1 Tax=Pantanalinema sp. GBBB05 TaxID=2604139 RepID=UPI001E0619F0|nr:hypothetical protein [Pantanalinema sp. GBBB05]